MSEQVPSSGSCVRCGRALGLAAACVDGLWYGNAACADSGPCPLDSRAPRVSEEALYSRPRRFYRKRAPRELQRPEE